MKISQISLTCDPLYNLQKISFRAVFSEIFSRYTFSTCYSLSQAFYRSDRFLITCTLPCQEARGRGRLPCKV